MVELVRCCGHQPTGDACGEQHIDDIDDTIAVEVAIRFVEAPCYGLTTRS